MQTVSAPSFLDADRVVFTTNSVEDRLTFVIVRADGGGEISREKAPVATTGPFIPEFVITQPGFAALSVPLPIPAENSPAGTVISSVSEIFVVGSANVGGSRLQLTDFGANGEHNSGACGFPGETGCEVIAVGQDRATDTVVFASTCDPLSGTSNGNNVFAMRFDGSGLVQLTNTHGLTTEADGTVDVELPGPFGYPPVFR